MGLLKVFAVRNLDNLTVKQRDEHAVLVYLCMCVKDVPFVLREIMQIYGWQLAGRESQPKPRQ